MSKNNSNLIWLDMEMSGLNPETDMILEIALVITDPYLTIIGEGPVIVIHQSDEVLGKNGFMESVYPWKIRPYRKSKKFKCYRRGGHSSAN